ncbi:MAG: hypothetical protein U9P70_04490, partial [Patescibacteria group bacterium]|nr:hypothetical protein [Patescibacteria group bacterium]
EEIDKLEKEREEYEEKKKEEIERLRKDKEKKKKPKKGEDELEQKMIAGHLTTVKKKVYDHKLKVFRHNKLNDFSGSGTKKMEKVLHKVHGVSPKKKAAFIKAVKTFNPTKAVLKKKDFDNFTRRFKSKRFVGDGFKRIEKEGIDIKEMRKGFGKRDIDKLRRGITGQSDPHKYKSRGSDLKNTSRPSAGRTSRPPVGRATRAS